MLKIFLLLLLNSLISCHSNNTKPSILIGEIDSMTGSEATFGENTYRGIKLAFDEVNKEGGILGHQIKLIKADAQGKPDEATRAASRLITQDHVRAIITGATSSNAIAMAPLANQYKIPLIATAATAPKLTEMGPYIFRVCFIDSFQGERMAQFSFTQLGFKKIALLRDIRSDYSIGLADVFSTLFTQLGGNIVIDQKYSAGDIDFKSQLTAIRAKQPDAIFVPGYYTDVSLIARQVQDLGLQIPLLGSDGWDSPKLTEIAGKALAGSYFSTFYASDNPAPTIQRFLFNYEKTYPIAPDGSSAMGYEAAQFLIANLKRAHSLEELDHLADLLQTSKTVNALAGPLKLDSHRNAIRSIVVLKINSKGQFEHFSTFNP